MSSFSQDKFLGSTSGGDIEELINTLAEKVFYRDGSKSMQGPIGMGSNNIIGSNVIETNELALGITPAAGKVSIYALTDKKLYIKDDAGLETELAGGTGDVVGPAGAVTNNLAIYPSNTGKVISDSLISKNNVAQASSNLTANTLLRGDGGVKNIKDSVVSLNSGVISGLTGITSSGIIDLNTITSFDLSTTSNTANALNLQSGGGTTASQRILNSTGTSANSILIDSTAGGIQFDSSSGVKVASGGFSVSSGIIDFNTFGGTIDFFDLLTTQDSTNAIRLRAQGGTSVQCDIINLSGTGSASLNLESSDGGIRIDSSTNMDINCSDGPIQIGTENVAQAINVGTTGARTITMGNNTANINLNAGSIGFFNASPAAKPTITGTRNGNSALADLLSDLDTMGLIDDDTSAGSGGGGGDVSSNTTSTTLNRLALFADTNGKLIKEDTSIYASSGSLFGLNDLFVNNVHISGNTISTIATNNNLILSADGSGIVRILNILKVEQLYQLAPTGATETVIVNSSGDLGTIPSPSVVQRRNSALWGVPNNYTDISWDTTDVNTNTTDLTVLSTTRIRVNRAGYFETSFQAIFDTEDDTEGDINIELRKNGVVMPGGHSEVRLYHGGATDKEDWSQVFVKTIALLAVNDQLSVAIDKEPNSNDMDMRFNSMMWVRSI